MCERAGELWRQCTLLLPKYFIRVATFDSLVDYFTLANIAFVAVKYTLCYKLLLEVKWKGSNMAATL